MRLFFVVLLIHSSGFTYSQQCAKFPSHKGSSVVIANWSKLLHKKRASLAVIGFVHYKTFNTKNGNYVAIEVEGYRKRRLDRNKKKEDPEGFIVPFARTDVQLL